MPICVKKDGIAARIATNILGPNPGGLTDSFGNKKRFVKSRNKDAEKLYQERMVPEKVGGLQENGVRW